MSLDEIKTLLPLGKTIPKDKFDKFVKTGSSSEAKEVIMLLLEKYKKTNNEYFSNMDAILTKLLNKTDIGNIAAENMIDIAKKSKKGEIREAVIDTLTKAAAKETKVVNEEPNVSEPVEPESEVVSDNDKIDNNAEIDNNEVDTLPNEAAEQGDKENSLYETPVGTPVSSPVASPKQPSPIKQVEKPVAAAKPKCKCVVNGRQCGNNAKLPDEFCHLHNNGKCKAVVDENFVPKETPPKGSKKDSGPKESKKGSKKAVKDLAKDAVAPSEPSLNLAAENGNDNSRVDNTIDNAAENGNNEDEDGPPVLDTMMEDDAPVEVSATEVEKIRKDVKEIAKVKKAWKMFAPKRFDIWRLKFKFPSAEDRKVVLPIVSATRPVRNPDETINEYLNRLLYV